MVPELVSGRVLNTGGNYKKGRECKLRRAELSEPVSHKGVHLDLF